MIAIVAALTVFSPQLVRLENGLSLILDADAGEKMVTIFTVIRANDRPPRELAALELVAEAMSLESKNFSKAQIEAITTYVGGTLRCQMVGDSVQVELTTAPSHFGTAATLLGDLLQRATFTADSLAAAKARLELKHERLAEDPAFIPLRIARDRLDAGPSAVQPISDDQATRLYDFIVRPDRTTIAVVGAFDPDAVKTRLVDGFEAWEKPTSTVRLPPPVAAKVPPTPAVAVSAIEGPAIASPEFAPWLVACAALATGKDSALHSRLRADLGWTYEQSISFSVRQGKVIGLAFAVSHLASAADLEAEIEKVIAGLPDALTEKSIARAKEYAAGWYRSGPPPPHGRYAPFAQGHAGAGSRAFWLAWWHEIGGNFLHDVGILDAIAKVTVEQAKAAATSFRKSVAAP